jgi:hypothetical protein
MLHQPTHTLSTILTPVIVLFAVVFAGVSTTLAALNFRNLTCNPSHNTGNTGTDNDDKCELQYYGPAAAVS